MSAIPSPCWKCARFRQRPAGSASKLHTRNPESRGYRARLRRAQGPRGCLYVCLDTVLISNRIRINTLALVARLPTMHGERDFVEVGGLMSYGPNFAELWRRSAEYVDKILRGAKPGEIPVEQPTKFELVINLITA